MFRRDAHRPQLDRKVHRDVSLGRFLPIVTEGGCPSVRVSVRPAVCTSGGNVNRSGHRAFQADFAVAIRRHRARGRGALSPSGGARRRLGTSRSSRAPDLSPERSLPASELASRPEPLAEVESPLAQAAPAAGEPPGGLPDERQSAAQAVDAGRPFDAAPPLDAAPPFDAGIPDAAPDAAPPDAAPPDAAPADNQDAALAARAPEGGACGPLTCAPGKVCCNASCGTCTDPGELCDQLVCGMSAVPESVRCGPNTCNVGEVCCNDSCGYCTLPGGTCDSKRRCFGATEYPQSQMCGMQTCNTGFVCCNPSCGICKRPGEPCTQRACG